MQFIEFLKEYNKTQEHGGVIPSTELTNLLSIEKYDILPMHISRDIGSEHFDLAFYRIKSRNDETIILTDTHNKNIIAGYFRLTRVKDNIWVGIDAVIYDKFRKLSLGIDLYTKLAMSGYIILNGYSLSTDAEKMWNKLKTVSRVKVQIYDKKNDKFYNLDQIDNKMVIAPEHDATTEDDEQNWFYALINAANNPITEKKCGCDEEHTRALNEEYFDWLDSSRGRKVYMTYYTQRYGEIGDF